MSKESIYNLDRRCIFREMFNSEADVRRNGGVPTGVTFSNGKATFVGTSATNILYKNKPLGTVSVRMIFSSPPIGFLFQSRDNQSTPGNASFVSGNTVVGGSANYVDGVLNGSITNTTREVVVAGIIFNKKEFLIGAKFNLAVLECFTGSLELFEIYSGTLTANEVANLYNSKTYKQPVLDHDEQLGPELIDQSNWYKASYWNTFPANWSQSGNTLVSNGGTGYISKNSFWTSYKRYKVTYTIIRSSGTITLPYDGGGAGFPLVSTSISETKTYYYYPAAAIGLYINSSSFNGTLSALSIREVLVNSTKTILDICACRGGIMNKLSGNPYVELCVNGGFDSDTFWGKDSRITIADGVCHFSNVVNASGLYKTSFLTNGKTYRITYTILNYVSGSCSVYAGINGIVRSANGTYTEDVTVSSIFYIWSRTNGTTLDIDNISIKEVIPSVVNTATNAVKDGDSNVMLFTKSTGAINPGSYDPMIGDKTFISWLKSTENAVASNIFLFGSQYIRFKLSTIQFTSSGSAWALSGTPPRNMWFLLVATRTSTGIVNFYINGILSGSANQSSGTPASVSSMTIGPISEIYSNKGNQFRIIDGLLTPTEISQLFSQEKQKYGL